MAVENGPSSPGSDVADDHILPLLSIARSAILRLCAFGFGKLILCDLIL